MQENKNDKVLMDVLSQEGVLINISIGYWRASKGLKAEDLGLDNDDINQEYISLGRKKLLKKEILQPFAKLEGRAHQLINNSTFPFMNGIANYLTNGKLDHVISGLHAIQQEFEQEKHKFIENYPAYRDNALKEWENICDELGADKDHVLAEVNAGFPTPNVLLRKFRFTWSLFHVRVPEEMQVYLTETADAKARVKARKDAAAMAKAHMENQLKGFVTECVASVREQLVTLCAEMIDSMDDGKSSIHQKTLNRLIRFTEDFKAMNFAGDTEMEGMLEEFKQKFLTKKAVKYRDDEFALAALKGGIRKLGDKAAELAATEEADLEAQFLGQYERMIGE